MNLSRAILSLLLCASVVGPGCATAGAREKDATDKKEKSVSAALTAGNYERRIQHDGRDRYYLLHIPPSYKPGTPMPVLLALHGGASNPENFRSTTDFDKFADEKGFIVAYPAGTGDRGSMLTWNILLSGTYATANKVDDIGFIKKVLNDIDRVVPGYDEKQGYELAGFVWFQGFNDYVDGGVYPEQDQPGGYDLYANLLGHFIRDVRKDLSAPKLPFVIGVMGIDGMRGDTNAPMMHFREAQRKPVALDEFKGNVFAVETAPFWDDDLEKLQERMDRLNDELDAKFNKSPEMSDDAKERSREKAIEQQFKPKELKRLRTGVSNGGYHYLGAAKIMAPIGKAFAEALLGIRADR